MGMATAGPDLDAPTLPKPRARGITTIKSPAGVPFTVHADHADKFTGFLGALEGAGYKINANQSGGYNYRTIAGTNKLSNHAHGAAIDINWTDNPRGRPSSTLPANIGELAQKHGLTWGGTWKNPDPMHFEVTGANAVPHTHDAPAAPAPVTAFPTSPAGGTNMALGMAGAPPSLEEIDLYRQRAKPFLAANDGSPTTGWGALGRIASSITGSLWMDKAAQGLRQNQEASNATWGAVGDSFRRPKGLTASPAASGVTAAVNPGMAGMSPTDAARLAPAPKKVAQATGPAVSDANQTGAVIDGTQPAAIDKAYPWVNRGVETPSPQTQFQRPEARADGQPILASAGEMPAATSSMAQVGRFVTPSLPPEASRIETGSVPAPEPSPQPPAPAAIAPKASAPQTVKADPRLAEIDTELGHVDRQIESAIPLLQNQATRAQGLAMLQSLQQRRQHFEDLKLARSDPAEVLRQRATELQIAQAEQNIENNKRQFKQVGVDDLGNPSYGFVDPVSQSVTPYKGTSIAATDGDRGRLTGEDYLKTLNPAIADEIRGYAEGRIPFNPTMAQKPRGQALIKHIMQYDPNFDAVNYTSRSQTRKDFTSGASAKNITSFNTAIGHLGHLEKAIDGLENGNFTWWNALANKVREARGDSEFQGAVNKFETARTAVTEELARAFKGMGATVTEVHEWEKKMSSADSPTKLRAGISEAVDLLKSRIDALGMQYNKGMGTTKDPMELLSPESRALFERLQNIGHGDRKADAGKIPPAAIQHLKSNPSLADAFDQKYGPGSARTVLGAH